MWYGFCYPRDEFFSVLNQFLLRVITFDVVTNIFYPAHHLVIRLPDLQSSQTSECVTNPRAWLHDQPGESLIISTLCLPGDLPYRKFLLVYPYSRGQASSQLIRLG